MKYILHKMREEHILMMRKKRDLFLSNIILRGDDKMIEQRGYEKDASRRLFQHAKKFIPGGVTANIKHFAPYPIFMKKGYGSKLIDVDGVEYIDYSLCYGALMTGHGHPRIREATLKQLDDSGTVIFGTPHELEVKMAEKLITLYPSMDQVRFTNSGTEAVLLAIRLAVAYTNKPKIGKFEGHYHGGLNQLLVSINPTQRDAGRPDQPEAVFESDGIVQSERENTIVLPFNDLEATEKLLRKHQDELAAVILEPVQGGFIPAEPQFIRGLRDLTNELGIVLIFDEVKTGFRVALGGAQSVYDVDPDITTLGKVLGGGFPIGAVGGHEEIMMQSAATAKSDVFSVGSDSHKTKNIVFHSGTYNGHPFVLAAGLETIRLLEDENELKSTFEKTMLLRKELEKLYETYHIKMQTIGMGSIFNLVFTDQTIRHYRDMWQADTSFRQAIDIELLKLGIYLKPLNRYSTSTAHTVEDIEKTVSLHERAIHRVLQQSEPLYAVK